MSSTPEELDPETAAGEGPPNSQQLYSILGDKRRRYTVHYLKQQDSEVSVRDVAEQVAAWENYKELGDLTSQERKRVYISLYQSHLPTLDSMGVVEYDKDRGTVKLSDHIRNQNIVMEVVPESSIPWGLYYLGLVAAAATVIGLVWLEVRPFGVLSPLQWATVIVAAFAVSAVVHTMQSRGMRLGDEGPPPDWDEPSDKADAE